MLPGRADKVIEQASQFAAPAPGSYWHDLEEL
jgi:hypothetical protein